MPAGASGNGDERGLQASNGTWVVPAGAIVHPGAKPLLAQAHVLRRLPNILEVWEDFRNAETPVSQADALLQFANAMTRLGWDYYGELDDPADDAPIPDGSGPPVSLPSQGDQA
ncbi:hypothetical protein GCM10009623_34400 [Nocardioides aestuarii]|uniref:Uncharacterized protein n=1 Tax=Nocardioides aestuarii TaxID=252231 RepID=A0ABW4TSF0_9ACTN